jgi:hypothetical protein
MAVGTSDDPFGQQTSGQTSFRLLSYDLVKEAFSYCEIALDSEGEALTDGYYSEGLRSLNQLIATWQGQGIHLWTYQEGYLFLEAGVNSYVLENVRATNRYLQTTTTTDILSAGNSVELASVSEIDEDWYIGVLNSSNNLVWRTVAGVSGNQVTINDNWGEDISSGADVFYYESAVRPVERVLDVRRNNVSSQSNETPVAFESHEHFFRLPNKTSQGSISEATYDRTLPDGVLYVWQTPANSAEQIRFTYERKIEDFVNTDDCPDFPKYWTEALVFNLARRLAMKYRVPMAVKEEIKQMAMETLDDALSFDNANYSTDISINRTVR